jgi:hypothetical protein
MVSPVSLSATGVIIAGATAIAVGLAQEPPPLPGYVVAPVHFTPSSPRPTGVTSNAHGTWDGAVQVPNRPQVFHGPGPGSGNVSDGQGRAGGRGSDGTGR